MSRPPSQAVIEAVEQAERDHGMASLYGTFMPYVCDCGFEGDGPDFDAHRRVEVARAAETAALRAAAARMDDLSRGAPLAAAITARAAAKRLARWADELTDETGEQ